MNKYYLNGAEVSERRFKICNYLYNPLTHYTVISGKYTFEWGRIPGIKLKRNDKND